MSQEFKDALITFGRGAFAAGVAAAITYITGLNLSDGLNTLNLIEGVIMAFIAGVLLFAGQYLRNVQSKPIPVPTDVRPRMENTAGPYRQRTKVWADYLPI